MPGILGREDGVHVAAKFRQASDVTWRLRAGENGHEAYGDVAGAMPSVLTPALPARTLGALPGAVVVCLNHRSGAPVLVLRAAFARFSWMRRVSSSWRRRPTSVYSSVIAVLEWPAILLASMALPPTS